MNIILALQENSEATLEELEDEENKIIARLAEITIERAQIELVKKVLIATNFNVENTAKFMGNQPVVFRDK